MSGNIIFLGNKIFEIPPFFQTRPGDLGKKVHACSVRFSALKVQVLVFFYYYLGVRGVLDRMLPFFFTDLPDVTGPSMLSGTKNRIKK